MPSEEVQRYKLVFTLAGFFAFGSGLGGAGLWKRNAVNYWDGVQILKQFQEQQKQLYVT